MQQDNDMKEEFRVAISFDLTFGDLIGGSMHKKIIQELCQCGQFSGEVAETGCDLWQCEGACIDEDDRIFVIHDDIQGKYGSMFRANQSSEVITVTCECLPANLQLYVDALSDIRHDLLEHNDNALGRFKGYSMIAPLSLS